MTQEFNCPQIIAHRGASYYAPENTQAAIELAAQQGAKWIEVDLHLTADQRVILMHDPTVDRCTNGYGAVAQLSYADIIHLDAGSWYGEQYIGQRVLSLETLIELLNRLDINVNLEIKAAACDISTIVQAVINVLRKFWPNKKPYPLLSSFSMGIIQAIRNMAPEFPRAMLIKQWDNSSVNLLADLECVSINIDKHAINAAVLASMHKTGKKILVYTVDDLAEAVELINMGVDGLITNRPDALINTLKINNLYR